MHAVGRRRISILIIVSNYDFFWSDNKVKEILCRIIRIMVILLFVSIVFSATFAAVSTCSDEDKVSHEGGHHYGGHAYDERYEEGGYHYGGSCLRRTL
jgi:hypothetical protein